MRRPAENTALAGGVLAVLAALLGLPVEVVGVIAGIGGALPRVVSWVIDNGGVRGAVRLVWRGRGSD